jgi:hypothetical protein
MKLRCLIIALAFLAAFASDSWGQSKQPTPPPTQPAQTNQASKPYERGTEQSPVIVKILPTKESEEKAAADTHREDEKTENDRRLARFTELLFWATVALSVIAFFQLIVFGWQGIQLKRTVDLGREEFISTHRPLLRIKFVERTQVETAAGERVGIKFSIVNAGTTRAQVTGSTAYVDVFAPDDWPNPNDYGRNNVIGNRRFKPGATDRYTAVSDNATLFDAYASGANQVRLYGYVVYEDDAGVPITTYFCRVHDRERDRFIPPDNPDYDSTD